MYSDNIGTAPTLLCGHKRSNGGVHYWEIKGGKLGKKQGFSQVDLFFVRSFYLPMSAHPYQPIIGRKRSVRPVQLGWREMPPEPWQAVNCLAIFIQQFLTQLKRVAVLSQSFPIAERASRRARAIP